MYRLNKKVFDYYYKIIDILLVLIIFKVDRSHHYNVSHTYVQRATQYVIRKYSIRASCLLPPHRSEYFVGFSERCIEVVSFYKIQLIFLVYDVNRKYPTNIYYKSAYWVGELNVSLYLVTSARGIEQEYYLRMRIE